MILDIGVLDIMRALREMGSSARAETQEKKAQTTIRYCNGGCLWFFLVTILNEPVWCGLLR